MKNYKIASISAIVFVVLLAIGFGVNAFVGSMPTTVIENAEIVNVEAPSGAEFGAMASPDIASVYLNVNGDRELHIRGSFTDESLFIVTIDPADYGFDVSSTSMPVVDTIRLRVDGVATTTWLATCGASTAKTVAPAYDLMTTGSVATSTGLNCVMENGMLTADNNASLCPDGGAIHKISLSPEYDTFVCHLTANIDAGITGAWNTFEGEFLIRMSILQ